MKRLLIGILLIGMVLGCSTLGAILDAIPDPVYPVCDKEAVGSQWQGKACLKYSDGSYRWVDIKQTK